MAEQTARQRLEAWAFLEGCTIRYERMPGGGTVETFWQASAEIGGQVQFVVRSAAASDIEHAAASVITGLAEAGIDVDARV